MKIQQLVLCAVTAFGLSTTTAFARNEYKNDAPAACKQIAETCKNAGFTKGEWKKSDGLWRECVDPILRGDPAAPGSAPLPTVDPSTAEECKREHPRYGSGQ